MWYNTLEVILLKKISKLKGFESVLDTYYITKKGEVYSSLNDMFLKQGDNGHGYKNIGLKVKNEKKWKKAYIHRLVAEAFIPNPTNKPCVNHIDEIRSNNNFKNLEWVTHSENINHGTYIENAIKKRSASEIYVYDYKGVFLSKELSLNKATLKYLKHKETRARNKRSGNFFFMEKEVLTSDTFVNAQEKHKSVVLINILSGDREIFPHLSCLKGFPTINKTDWVSKKWIVSKKFKLEYYDFKTYAELTGDNKR